MEWIGSFTGTTAAWVAAFISLISMVINIWIPSRHRPQASFTLVEHLIPGGALYTLKTEGHPSTYRIYKETHKAYHLRNTGDGAGYNLSINFLDCRGQTAIMTGANSLDIATNGVFSTTDNLWVFIEADSLSKSSAIEVHWVTPPTRLNHCRYQLVSVPAAPTSWGRINHLVEAAGQWCWHRYWHHRNRKSQLHFQ